MDDKIHLKIDKIHLKIVNIFGVLLFISLFLMLSFYFTHKNWNYYTIFWAGFILILINLILWLFAINGLEYYIKNKNPYEE